MLCTGRPLAAIRMSPARTPARAAGEPSATSCAVTPSPCARQSTPSSNSDQVARTATFATARQSNTTTMAACAIRRSQVARRLLAWGSRIDDTGIRREGSNWRSLAKPCPITLSPCQYNRFRSTSSSKFQAAGARIQKAGGSRQLSLNGCSAEAIRIGRGTRRHGASAGGRRAVRRRPTLDRWDRGRGCAAPRALPISCPRRPRGAPDSPGCRSGRRAPPRLACWPIRRSRLFIL